MGHYPDKILGQARGLGSYSAVLAVRPPTVADGGDTMTDEPTAHNDKGAWQLPGADPSIDAPAADEGMYAPAEYHDPLRAFGPQEPWIEASRRRFHPIVWVAVALVLAVLGIGAIRMITGGGDTGNDQMERDAQAFADALGDSPAATGGGQGATLQARGFVIGIPPGWEGRTSDQETGGAYNLRAILNPSGGPALSGHGPMISVGAVHGPRNLDQAERASLASLANRPRFARRGTTVNLQVNGVPARRFDYVIQPGDTLVEVRCVVIVQDETAFVVVFHSTPERFDAEANALDLALEGWRPTD